MPTYEFCCRQCGAEFEQWTKMEDLHEVLCTLCGSKKIEQLLSLSSFHLKGSGWAHDSYGASKAAAQHSVEKKISKETNEVS